MLKKIMTSLLLGLIASSLFAAPATQQHTSNQNAQLYHAYQGEQYVADSSSSTEGYVTTKKAEEYRPFRVQIFIPGLFIGRFGATIGYKLSNAFAIGGLYRTWTNTGSDCIYDDPSNPFQCQNKSYTDFYNVYGLNMEYAVNGNLNMSGWILNPRLLQADYRFHDGFLETDPNKINKTQHSTEAGIYLMYQWAWPTGIYMQLGIGADYMSNPNKNIFSISNSHFGGDWDYTIGYQF